MAKFILRVPREARRGLKRSLREIVLPFGDQIEILDSSGSNMMLLEADEEILKQIVSENEGLEYNNEVIYTLPDPPATIHAPEMANRASSHR